MHGVNVSPVVRLDDVNHDLRLVVIRWNDTHEGAEASLVRQVFGGRGVADLRDGEELKEILNLQGDGARGGSGDADQRSVFVRSVGQGGV